MSNDGSAAVEWVADAWRATRDEIVFFARTAWAFITAPATFATRWVNGETRPMNPLGFLSFCLLFQAPLHIAMQWRMRAELDTASQQLHLSTESLDLLRGALPYMMPVLFCLLVHPFLRVLGSTRRLSMTLGILLYGSAPSVIIAYLVAPVQYWIFGHPPTEAQHLVTRLSLAQSIPSLVYLVVGLGATHGLRAWRSALAVLLAFATMMIASSALVIAGVWIYKHTR